jgi:hypothetical protein
MSYSDEHDFAGDILCEQVIDRIDSLLESYKMTNRCLEDARKVIRQNNEHILIQNTLIKKMDNTIDEITATQANKHVIIREYSQIVERMFNKLISLGMTKSNIQNMFSQKSFPGVHSQQSILTTQNHGNVENAGQPKRRPISTVENAGQPKRLNSDVENAGQPKRRKLHR